MKKNIETVQFFDFELEVECYYIPAEKGSYNDPEYSADYEIHAVYYKGIEITEVLEEFDSEWASKITDLLLNK